MGNFQKLRRYLKRNGLKNTYYAAKERLTKNGAAPYNYAELSEKSLISQREASVNAPVLISIVVPVYETGERFLRELIDSVMNQTYGNWQLVLADASVTDGPEKIIAEYRDARITYTKLSKNAGISSNTNEALLHATGDYVALLDHDDLLTADALFEVASMIIKAKAKGIEPAFIYSDEDKCDGEGKKYFEPNIKPEFNYYYLLSNNYICHLSVIKRDFFDKYKFRPEFDGAQDHDLFVRITGDLMKAGEEKRILHIPKVLYHWRCHEASTSANTDSKNYAYEAGRNCVADYTGVPTHDSLHKGFYVPEFGEKLFVLNEKIGAVGGIICEKNKIVGGIYDEDGNCPFKGMNSRFSGYLNRAHCLQEVFSLDIRNLTPRACLANIHARALYGMQLDLEKAEKNPEEIYRYWNAYFAKEVKNAGYKLLFDPDYSRKTSYINEEKENTLPVSVIIPNYNGASFLGPCLDSLLRVETAPSEIIVVDNGSTDDSLKLLKEQYPQVTVIAHEKNLGFTGAVNHGIVAASERFVFLLNNDTVIEPDCIDKLYEAMRADERIFSAGALMLSMDHPDLVDNAGDSYNLLGYPRSFASGKLKINFYSDKVADVFTACAGAAMYDGAKLREIGLFDDRHFAYFEDVDIGYRARIYGYKNVNVRNAVVYHKGSAVSGSKHNAFKVNLSSRNSVLVPMKNMPLLQYVCNLPFLIIGVIIKALFFTMKGFGGIYVKGIFRGIGMSIGKKGRKHHVKFRFSHMKNLFLIQIYMIKALFGA